MSQPNKEINQILSEAVDLTSGKLTYINIVRFTVTSNEVFVDFYTVTPSPDNPNTPLAERIHRIAMPLAIAKDFAAKMLEGIGNWEATHGVNLPFSPVPGLLDEE